jgi:hypothetical protein
MFMEKNLAREASAHIDAKKLIASLSYDALFNCYID